MVGFDDDEAVDDLDIPRLRVALRIRGDALDPDFLTQQLGVAPSFSARKGEMVARRGRERLHTTGWEEITSSFLVDVFCGVFSRTTTRARTSSPRCLARSDAEGCR